MATIGVTSKDDIISTVKMIRFLGILLNRQSIRMEKQTTKAENIIPTIKKGYIKIP